MNNGAEELAAVMLRHWVVKSQQQLQKIADDRIAELGEAKARQQDWTLFRDLKCLEGSLMIADALDELGEEPISAREVRHDMGNLVCIVERVTRRLMGQVVFGPDTEPALLSFVMRRKAKKQRDRRSDYWKKVTERILNPHPEWEPAQALVERNQLLKLGLLELYAGTDVSWKNRYTKIRTKMTKGVARNG